MLRHRFINLSRLVIMMDLIEFLQDMSDGGVMFKNSESYNCPNWTTWDNLTTAHPIQRSLTPTECVFDFDNITEVGKTMVCNLLEDIGWKFFAYDSSDTGLHVHFWTDVYGKDEKEQLTRFMAGKIESQLKVKNDIQPMRQNMIRSEWSIHPVKKCRKKLRHDTMKLTSPLNIIPEQVRTQIRGLSNQPRGNGRTGDNNGKMTKCVRFIWSNKFSDGRKRMVFVLVSWFKASGFNQRDTVDLVHEWCRRQCFTYPRSMIHANYESSQAQVGCRFRHELLEELGFDCDCDGRLL